MCTGQLTSRYQVVPIENIAEVAALAVVYIC